MSVSSAVSESYSVLKQLSWTVAYTSDLSTLRQAVRYSWGLVQPGLQSVFQDNQGYTEINLVSRKKEKEKRN